LVKIINIGIVKSSKIFKDYIQNLGHKNVGTTFTSYGTLSVDRQGEVIKNGGIINNNANDLNNDEL
jgi:hypothetical protein